jgi:hypothetical protein
MGFMRQAKGSRWPRSHVQRNASSAAIRPAMRRLFGRLVGICNRGIQFSRERVVPLINL